MKQLLLPILLLCFFKAFSQKAADSVFELKQLPSYVTGQWRFHPGDNPKWADTTFNDSSWQHVDPTRYLHFLPQIACAQLGWFRLKLAVAPALRRKTVALVVNQRGAAAVYFNGVLLRTMGHISANYNDEQTRRSVREPLTIQLSDAPFQYVAVRYSFNQSNGTIGYGSPVLIAGFRQPDDAWDFFFQMVHYYTTRAFVSGCFILLGILQLAIYFFNLERKINLYLSLYAFLQLFTLANGLLLPMLPGANWEVFFNTLFNFSAPTEFIFLSAMTYAIFGYKPGWWFYLLAILCLPTIILQFLGDNLQNQEVLAIYNSVSYLSIIIISAKALRQKKTGAVLFLAGIIVSFIFFLLFNLSGPATPFLMRCIEVALTFLTPAVILSILLAREFAQNVFSLRQKLAEVQTLSTANLLQEAEKQQILARQNETLEQKVTERTAELNQLITDLKVAQRQLVQSEKMASLGELTAGIAHEIQNPLNFVNNFSDVNQEMLIELREELDKGDVEEAKAIAADIEQNEVKINHHGKRADAIVKGMLQHSRTSSGQKELTDLNKLADEYLRLAFHGQQAKHKNFNPELITNFDGNLPRANVIPQDMGRVLLNLFNNAFYAVSQKQKTAGADYTPEVSVTTSAENGSVVIKVKDNGTGIPDSIKDKIMQPFFTTKPTGEGTGLGLSLTYDIVVKGHGGSIDVDTKESEFTEFTVTLQIS